ncbi:LPXTG cell wall anchor domain-containing protein [Faecalimonas sp. LCP19S3_D12]
MKTGDESSLLVYGVMMMVALGAGVIFRKREEH